MKTNPKVLVIDDDPNIRKTLADILRVKGYEVEVAADGAAGIVVANGDRVNVALIDLKLPDMTGIEVMERIKLITPLTEAIILTGNADLDSAIAATNKGAFSYLLKPCDIDKLLRHIRRALERQQTQEEILRLASFPRMSPDPVIEVNFSGEVSYLSPAAVKLFPDIISTGTKHPMLANLEGLFQAFCEDEMHEIVREVAFEDAMFEQRIYCVKEGELIRITALDITKRKAQEVRVNRLYVLLLTIRKIKEHLLIAGNEEELATLVCGTLKELEDIVGVIIAIKQPDYTLKPLAWSGFAGADIHALQLRWDESVYGGGVVGIAAREGRDAFAGDIENDPQYDPWREFIQTWKIKSASAVPLHSDGEVIGMLAVYSARRNSFDQEIVLLLDEVAGDVAAGVRALRLVKRLHATLDNLKKSMGSTVEAISRMVELRDPYTAGHERRVAQLAAAIGKEMRLPERQVEGLGVIGHLHDIGKIAAPAEILSKAGKLTAVEYELIKAHARSGYDILKDLEFPWPVAQAVLQHHERLDGSGYPQGLKGDEIILEARIVMVADVVEAMTAHRPYRAMLGIEAALEEINNHKGVRYDARVVEACTKLFAEEGFKFDVSA